LLRQSALRPKCGRSTQLSQRTGAPRPTRSRMTHDWQQVSWLAGRCLRPPSQDRSIPVVLMVAGSPLTVAGAAAALPVETDAPHSLG
jgi:hypothetical protein